MKKGDNIKVYQDGKYCRDTSATIIGFRAQGIKAVFHTMDSVETAWFRRRDRKGIYEAIGWNYWITLNS